MSSYFCDVNILKQLIQIADYNLRESSRHVPDRGKNTEQISEDRRTRRAHPYSRPVVRERKEYATFNLACKDLKELMLCMTTESFKQSNKFCSVQNKLDKRFQHYHFKRSSLSTKLDEKEKSSSELVRPEDIPNLEKRKLLADKVENLSESLVDETAKKKLDEMMKIYPSKENDAESVNKNDNCSSVAAGSKHVKGNNMDANKTMKELVKKSSQVCDEVKTLYDQIDDNINKTSGDCSDVGINKLKLDSSDINIIKTSGDVNIINTSGDVNIIKTSGDVNIIKTSGDINIIKTSGDVNIDNALPDCVDVMVNKVSGIDGNTIGDCSHVEVNLCSRDKNPIGLLSNEEEYRSGDPSSNVNHMDNTLKATSYQCDVNSLSDMSLDDEEIISKDIFVNKQNDGCYNTMLCSHQDKKITGSSKAGSSQHAISSTDFSLGDLNITSSNSLNDVKLPYNMLEAVSELTIKSKSINRCLPEVAIKNDGSGFCNETNNISGTNKTGHYNQSILFGQLDNQSSPSSATSLDLLPHMVYPDPSIKSPVKQSLPTKPLKTACNDGLQKKCKANFKKNAEIIITLSSLQRLSLDHSSSEVKNSSLNKFSELISNPSMQPQSRKNVFPGDGETSNQSIIVDSRFIKTFVSLPDSSCNNDLNNSKSGENNNRRTQQEVIMEADQETSLQESSRQNFKSCLTTVERNLANAAVSEPCSETMEEIKNSSEAQSTFLPVSLLASVQPSVLVDQIESSANDHHVCLPQKSGQVLKDEMPDYAVSNDLQDQRKIRLTHLMNVYRTRLLYQQEKDELQKLLLSNVSLTAHERQTFSQSYTKTTDELKSNYSGRMKLQKITFQAVNQDYKPNLDLLKTLISCTSDPSRDPRLGPKPHKKTRKSRLAKQLVKHAVPIPLEPVYPCPATVSATCTDMRDQT